MREGYLCLKLTRDFLVKEPRLRQFFIFERAKIEAISTGLSSSSESLFGSELLLYHELIGLLIGWEVDFDFDSLLDSRVR
jgi:hypothetical protein